MHMFTKVTSSLPSNLGYTAWIGLTAHTEDLGGQYFKWKSSTEAVSYTHWDVGEPGNKIDPIRKFYCRMLVHFS